MKKRSDMRSSFCVLFEKYFLFITFKRISSNHVGTKSNTAQLLSFPNYISSSYPECVSEYNITPNIGDSPNPHKENDLPCPKLV